MILHPKASHFRIDFWSKFHACSKRLPKPLFSALWPPKCTKISPYWIFCAVFSAPSDFHGSPKSQKKAQVAPKVEKSKSPDCLKDGPGNCVFPRPLSERSWVPFWLIFTRFWMDFEESAWILTSVFNAFQTMFATRFADAQRRLTRKELTAHIKNIHVSADANSIMFQPKLENAKNRQELTKAKR